MKQDDIFEELPNTSHTQSVVEEQHVSFVTSCAKDAGRMWRRERSSALLLGEVPVEAEGMRRG